MASDGLLNKAKKGKCRICHRVRKTETQLKAVGEVRHGYATGHIWECINIEECNRAANDKITARHKDSALIEIGLQIGRFKTHITFF